MWSWMQRQPVMEKVLWALLPVAVFSVGNFGWRAAAMLAVVNAAGLLTEWLFCRFVFRSKVSEAVLVTNSLFALSLPPTLPFWIAVVGIVFGVVFGKMVFGGFGRNVFNPALTGRAFIYVSFAVLVNNVWAPSFWEAGWSWPGGFAAWMPDAVTSATPLRLMRAGETVPLLPLVLGNIRGSFGETPGLLILLAGVWLCAVRAANWRIVVSTVASMLLFQFWFWKAGWAGAADPLRALFSGGFLYAAVFMATDPVSASQTDAGRWVYGALVGLLTAVIRTWSSWPEGAMFAVLLGNTFAPLIDTVVRSLRGGKEAAA